MVSKLFSNLNKGVTLVEIVVVVFLIAIFSMFLVSDFPKILKQVALSKATYKLQQDLRRVQDLGLSGITIKNDSGNEILAKGYGIYVDSNSQPVTQYLMYANLNNDVTYNSSNSKCRYMQGDNMNDCIIEAININYDNQTLLFLQ